MATIRGQAPDRPAVNFYEIGGIEVDASDQDEFNVYKDPSWQPLLKLAEEQTELIRMRSPVRSRSFDVEIPFDENRSLNRCDGLIDREEYTKNGRRFNRLTIRTGKRTLSAVTCRMPTIDTVWTVEHLLKDTDDVKAYLQLPDEVFAEEVSVAGLEEEEKKLLDRGIVMVDTEDPICAAASLLSMEDFMIVALTEQKLFHRLLEKHCHHIYARTEQTSEAFPGRLWRIYGPEYATEPYLPPHLFEEYVVRYTGPMVRTIRKHGGFARIHCHGRIRAVLDYIVEMGADAIDPIEPPPRGDVELDYVRREYGKELVLFGNLQIVDIETMERLQFERVVEKSLIDGTKGTGRGFVLMPSSAPNGREITPRVMANYETMIRLAVQFNL
ncbi:MAG: hypothetical protein JSU70_08660 [Phycisphaerales bacterium]|nr:MAG: hypothetical protein JSU70_08660 [Phycisphaerales bacterium]